jgi:hypothetical protein
MPHTQESHEDTRGKLGEHSPQECIECLLCVIGVLYVPQQHPTRAVKLDQDVAYQDMHVYEEQIFRVVKLLPLSKLRDAE